MIFKSVGQILLSVAEMLRPSERYTVSEAAEEFRYVNNPGAYVGPWFNKTTPMMVEPMDTFTSRDYSGIAFAGPAQSSKPLALDTPVPTPTGWTTIGDIGPGDRVFAADGSVTTVTYVTPVFRDRKCYRITFDDDSTIVADGAHRWSVNDMWARDPYAPRVLDTDALRKRYRVKTSTGERFRFSIPLAGELDLPRVELPIDPYILGLWLGDGCHTSCALILGLQDYEELVDCIEIDTDFKVTYVSDGNSAGTAKRVVLARRDGVTLRKLLTDNGLRQNKHIPPIYLRASFVQRRELLRGLMDSDGCVAQNGRIAFSQSRKELFDQVVELCTSLSLKPMVDVQTPKFEYKGEKKEGELSYRLAYCTEDVALSFKLLRQRKRHAAHIARRKSRPTHSGRRFIRNIEEVDSVPVRCISVHDAKHLFLVGKQMVPTHNTDSLILNTVVHGIMVEPMDMMIVCPTNTAARDFSIRRLDRLHRHSEKVGAMLAPGSDSDNTFDKRYINGMLVTLSWPTPTELAGKPIGRIVMTDFDRMPTDVDGDGNPYDLASKRTTTFGSYAMTLAESSPSHEVTDAKWIPRTLHEAPPTTGILALYNRGDKRRWYWPCPTCGNYFEGTFEMLTYEKREGQTNLEIGETARMKCPHKGCEIHPDSRDDMQQRGRWLKDGQGIDRDGMIFGPSPRTLIASFWLRGVAATFTSWKKLVALYLDAHDEYERTGSEEALRKFYNNDLGEPYYPKSLASVRQPETLKARAEPREPGREKHVPEGVRFLIATVDVQQNMWVVQVFGVLPGRPFDLVVIDRYNVKYSKRLNEADERLWVKPATYAEDWDELTEHVLEKEYPLDDDTGRMMSIRFVGCDSGGKAGVTAMAYNYYRKLREENKHRRFILIKGEGKPGIPRARIGYPDSSRKDSKAGARGDIPVLFLNSNLLKDQLNGRLDCLEPGKGMYRTPNYLADFFYAELCVETRTPKGWENPSGHRNEAWDLSYYAIGLVVSELMLVEKLDWENAPGWAAEWDRNDFVRTPEQDVPFAGLPKASYDFSKFGKELA